MKKETLLLMHTVILVDARTQIILISDGCPMTLIAEQYHIHTSGLGVSVPVCTFCFSSVLQASISASCLGVLGSRGLGGLFGVRPPRRSLLSECWEAAAGAEDVLGTGFSFRRDPTYPM